jgi:hypothetical protein
MTSLMSVFDHDAGVEPLPTVVGGSGSGNVNAKEQEYDNDSELDDDLDII